MSKFDPPAPRYDPATVAPPPGHQQNVQSFQGIETPPVAHEHEQTHPEGSTNHPNPPATVKKCNVARVVALSLRGASLLFSFLSFVIIATIKDFTMDDSYNYVFAIAMISFIYNIYQNGKSVFELVTRKQLIGHKKASALSDFIGDQVIAYMLMSGSSVGLALANQARQLTDALGLTGGEAGKIEGGASMLFFAFLTLIFPTLISALNLFNTCTCSNANVPKA